MPSVRFIVERLADATRDREKYHFFVTILFFERLYMWGICCGHVGKADTGGQVMETGWTTKVAHAVSTTCPRLPTTLTEK